jgi:hypothetical protein
MPRRASIVVLLATPLLVFACGGGEDGRGQTAGLSGSATAVTSITGASVGESGTTLEPTGGSGGVEGGGTSTGGGPSTDAVESSGGGSSSTGASVETTTGMTGPDATTGSDDVGESTGECAEITEMATNKKQPADIIFVIDNSGSMDVEAGSVKTNMNQFSSKIVASGIDVHVVLISELSGNTGMCIDAPLGSGGCPVKDTKLPNFLHIDDEVGSTNALPKLLQHHPAWKDSMRPDASKHVVVVSDDDSDMGANAFDAAFKALDPSYAGYKFHAIVGEKDSGDVLWCISDPVCCAFTASAGKVYLDLIKLTDGVWGDLCKQDFKPVFDVLSTEVIENAGLACEWVIPEPMGGDVIDYGKVNVDFDDGKGNVTPIGKVDGPDSCGGVVDGWYYDDPVKPTKILVCPQTCVKIQGAANAAMKLKFGCETIIAQ